jgi:hypothetical protein
LSKAGRSIASENKRDTEEMQCRPDCRAVAAQRYFLATMDDPLRAGDGYFGLA